MTRQYFVGMVNRNQYGQRLDQALTVLCPDFSRSRLKTFIMDGKVKVNGRIMIAPKTKMIGGEVVEIHDILKKSPLWSAMNIMLDIVYEDADIIVINKPCNLVVHPGAGNADGTLLNALLDYYPPIINLPRAGIIHRLDKNTTGLMVVAKTILAQTRLVQLLQAHKIVREYEAVAIGAMITGGSVVQPISRHFKKRTHMMVHPRGKPAITYYRIMEHFRDFTRLRLRLKTGRTHQIRVHMSYINHPLVGDRIYGGCPRLLKNANSMVNEVFFHFNRQALHATMLRFLHPITAIEMEWHAPLPQDMVDLVNILKEDKRAM